MPVLHIRTNQPASADLHEISHVVATALSKPESYVMLSLESCPDMLFGGSNAPCATLELKSIGLAESTLPKLSEQLCELMHKQLDIPPERVYIEFTDLQRSWFGWNKSTF